MDPNFSSLFFDIPWGGEKLNYSNLKAEANLMNEEKVKQMDILFTYLPILIVL